jgi:hypothetical protein
MFSLDHAGINAFDVTTRRGAFCGIISQTAKGDWRVFFNMTATKGSQRRFPTAQDAIVFIRDRRVKKGWGV